MYAVYTLRRTQIYLDEQQTKRLDERATVRGTTRSALIREAIHSYLGAPDDEAMRLARFQAAVDAAAGIAPYLPPGETYVDELRGAGARKLSELQRRRA